MKRAVILLVLLSLFTAVTQIAGCTKAEEAKKPETTAEAPTPPGARSLNSIPEKPGAPAMPLETRSPATPAAPAPGAPAIAPATPITPMKPPGTDIVLVTKFAPQQISDSIPAGWITENNGGTSFIRVEKEADNYCFHLVSDPESSFGIKKGVKVDIKEYPFLNWRWKVKRLPSGGDVRKSGKDDQAIQLYIAFPSTGFPAKLNTPVIGYIWDNEAPKEWSGRSPQIGGRRLRYIVVRNKTDALGQWHTEKRNIYEDYRKLFKDIRNGEPQGETQGVQLHINSQHTRSAAESYICDIYFSKN